MIDRNRFRSGVAAICAISSSSAFATGLTEEGARDIARIIQPSQSQLQLFSRPPTVALAFRLSALSSPGVAVGDAEKMYDIWHSFGLATLAFDHTPKIDDATGKEVHFQEFGPHRASYAMAMLHLAMYEVANGFKAAPTSATSWIERRLPGAVGSPPANASEPAALAAAARTMLNHLYMGDDYNVDSEYAASLAQFHLMRGDPGEAYGDRIASLIIGLRADDKSDLPEPMWGVDFTPKDPTGTPFQWQFDPVSTIKVALGGNWGEVTTFVASSPNIYVDGNPNFPPPTRDLNDPAFIAAFNEVKKCGVDEHALNETRDCGVSGMLDNEDTYYRAKFWSYDGTAGICAPVRLYNQIADEIFKQKKAQIVVGATSDTDVTAAEAKYYGRINLALADAGIVAWYAKYKYQYWRPITGVRSLAGASGGPANPKDRESWFPLGAQTTNAGQGFNITPPFPSYPSGHSVFGGAFFEVLRAFLTKPVDQQFAFQSDEYNGGGALQPNVDAFNYVRCLDDPSPPHEQKTYCMLRTFNFYNEDVSYFDPDNAHFDPANAEGENSNSRIWMGVHWRFDGDNGIRVGRQVGDDVIANFP